MFKLSSCVRRLGREGILLRFFLFCFDYSAPSVYPSRNVWVLSVTVAGLYSSSAAVTRAVSSVVGGSAVCLLVPFYPHNPET
jgi:hypothetical protein